MTAVVRTFPTPLAPVGLRALPVAARPRPTAARFRRRRAVAALGAVVLLGAGAVLAVPGEGPLTSSGTAPALVPVGRATYVVQPGDTLWGIARALQPAGDVRPLVHRLAASRGGAPLQAGERVALPAG
ncbi:MAG: LysM peptidoglycan-binding domain-containing protein [Actinomycetota bacterium]